MSILTTAHPWRLALLTGLLVVSALWLGALMANPVWAHKPGGGKGGSTYDVEITGDVAIFDPSTFITVGNGKGTSLGGDPVKTFLDQDGIGVSTLEGFGVCGSPVPQTLDDVEWDFRFIRIRKDHLGARFDLHYESDCGFDDYTLQIVFDFELVETGGSKVYTPIGDALFAIIQYAEKRLSTKGKKKESFHETVVQHTGDITITITRR